LLVTPTVSLSEAKRAVKRREQNRDRHSDNGKMYSQHPTVAAGSHPDALHRPVAAKDLEIEEGSEALQSSAKNAVGYVLSSWQVTLLCAYVAWVRYLVEVP
jgi:hypothetical protein